jgi:lycopene cyclase domain-containing protein
MPEYTAMTVASMVAVVVVELLWLRTGIFRTLQYWCAMAIVFAFQIAVDGWLTKLSAPIVVYNPRQMLGWRAPWDIPIEDFGFGFTMVTLAILVWRWHLGRPRSTTPTLASIRPLDQKEPDTRHVESGAHD